MYLHLIGCQVDRGDSAVGDGDLAATWPRCKCHRSLVFILAALPALTCAHSHNAPL